jgi:putative ABC transport system substrate-binding protein
MQLPDAVGKRLELLREVVPVFRRLAIMVNVGFPDAVLEAGEAAAAARRIGIEVTTLEIRRAEDIAPPSSRWGPRGRTYVMADALTPTGLHQHLAAARLPTMHNDFRELVGRV